MDLSHTLDAIEKRILAGDLSGARSALRRVRAPRVPRELRVRYANLARRAEWPLAALNALAPILHPTPGSAPQGTDEERIEYGLALIRLSLVREGIEVFETVDADTSPRVLMGLMAAHFARWDHLRAIPLLRRYLLHPKPLAYDRLVAEVNLAAALVATEAGAEVEELLGRLFASARSHGSENLRGTLVLLQMQRALSRRDLVLARKRITEARPLFEPRGGKHALLWCKWAAILDLTENGPTERTAATFAAVAHAAREQAEWETARQLAANWALAVGDETLIARAYHGTPHPGFRRWVASKFPGAPALSPFSAELGVAPKEELRLDEVLGQDATRLERATLRGLCSDLFRPVRLVELHPAIYGEQDFDPIAGPERLKFALKALRAALRDRTSPIQVTATGEGYRLESHPAIRLWIPAHEQPTRADDDAAVLERIRNLHAEAAALSSTSVAAALGWSDRTARRFLGRAVDRGLLVRTGEARATRYHFPLRKAG